MRIDVIGGSGFIGTRLVRRLQKSAPGRCSILDKSPSLAFPGIYMPCDVRSLDELRASISTNGVIINLAAEHRDDVMPSSLYYDVNVQGAKNICIVAREKRVDTIIFTSTVAVYGFAEPETTESGVISPFNHYGATKAEAEQIFRAWQEEAPERRTLVVVRPTVVFGEQNRGNVYKLLSQIVSGRFVMVGDGRNRKSMAYVENVAAFLEHTLSCQAGTHIINYVDKPDFDMATLVSTVRRKVGRGKGVGISIPYPIGYLCGLLADAAAWVFRRHFLISSIRVKKFCATTQFASAAGAYGFVAPVTLEEGLNRTVQHEFLERHQDEPLFFTE